MIAPFPSHTQGHGSIRANAAGPRDPQPDRPSPERPDPFDPASPTEIPKPIPQPDLPQLPPDEVPVPQEPPDVPFPREAAPSTDRRSGDR